ncbi:MAG: MiaB/RimO family radical SAM methylthiotransferase [Xanthomonadaceae bacterium]|nr:MiaB/RimO family radical SAM methylthiotransferase [Rhodospirillaceae bacterium]NIA18255.1 MiaB/RimO family radical SAM methylthiotransferase [Xanthomonadaceae bacterium]
MKYFIKTYGCQMNQSDSERIATVLDNLKNKEVSEIEDADLVIFNLCSVRQTAIDRIFGQLNKKKNKKQKIFLTGCILASDKKKFAKKVDLIFDIREIKKLKNFLLKKKFAKNKKFKQARDENFDFSYLKIKPKYKFKDKAFVPIMTGCNNFCSYCVVPYTRGKEYSRPLGDIIKEVKNLINNGCKEIILLGQNVNSYNSKFSIFNFQFSINFQFSNSSMINFANLLRIINSIEGDFKISFLTNHPKDMNNDLIDAIAKCDKVVKHIHLPFQSGDDEILEKMNRHYTQKDYLNLIKKIRKKIPEIKFSTDVFSRRNRKAISKNS